MPNKVTERDSDPKLVDLARRMFKVYAANSENRTHDNKVIPSWEQLTPAVRGHWCAAAIEGARYAADMMRAQIVPCPCKGGSAAGVVVVDGAAPTVEDLVAEIERTRVEAANERDARYAETMNLLQANESLAKELATSKANAVKAYDEAVLLLVERDTRIADLTALTTAKPVEVDAVAPRAEPDSPT